MVPLNEEAKAVRENHATLAQQWFEGQRGSDQQADLCLTAAVLPNEKI
jgi:hypothetical protein